MEPELEPKHETSVLVNVVVKPFEGSVIVTELVA